MPKFGRADVNWRDGVPISATFDDPYYSFDNGLEESRFVFLDGADVIRRSSNKGLFRIGETGFGSGLNFLATWDAWRRHNISSRLIFVSAEANPMDIQHMSKAHSHFPAIADLGHELRLAMPPPARGFHTRHFDGGQISLLLMYGDAAEAYSTLTAKIDAWYLDGFAPAKNKSMWTDDLFYQLARLSAPKSTLATFTAAGFVKRGLTAVGFNMKKTNGFGRKRERLMGTFSASNDSQGDPIPVSTLKWAHPVSSGAKRVAILGGGIAGASVAHALDLRGIDCTIIESPDAPMASSLPAAIMAPRFMLDDTPERYFFSSAFAFVTSHTAYADAFSKHLGIRYIDKNGQKKERFRRIVEDYAWPEDWLTLDEHDLVLPKAGTISPETVLSNLSKNAKKVTAQVTRIEKHKSKWLLQDQNHKTILETDCLVLATGLETPHILNNSGLGMETAQGLEPTQRPSGGQLEIVAAKALTGIPEQTLSYGGYVSATLENAEKKGIRTIGTTFESLEMQAAQNQKPKKSSQHAILQTFYEMTDGKLGSSGSIQSWAGARATVADHLPYAGPVPVWEDLLQVCEPLSRDATNELERAPAVHDGLYCLTGLGSKGFQYGPLLGEYLAAMITGEPIPIPSTLIAKLHPARSVVKNLIRHNTQGPTAQT